MQIKPFLCTAAGDLPLTESQTIRNEQKLKMIIFYDESEATIHNITHVEILNPIDKKVVLGSIPKLTPSTIASLEVQIPENWIGGRYVAQIITLEKKIVGSCSFIVFPNNSLVAYMTKRTLHPSWLINYRIQVRNPTKKPIGNFSTFIAIPITISPQQIIKKLTVTPAALKVSTDIEGNQWVHYERKRINPLENIELGYTAVVQSSPLLLSLNFNEIKTENPYTEQFLKPYLQSEPHIESDHPKIVALAESLNASDPLTYVRRAARLVNKKLTYKIQTGEFGAAYAIEKGEGDCTEFAALFVALCRAKGIPARVNAGFAFGQDWERHATAEFLVGGRWLPIDVTGQKDPEIFIGHLPNYILVTRGNWMGGTLAKEVSYRYQIIEQTQKLDVMVDWKITLFDKQSPIITPQEPLQGKSVKILDTTIIAPNNVKIIDNDLDLLISLPKKIDNVETNKRFTPVRTARDEKLAPLFVIITTSIPDALKEGSLKHYLIIIRNNSQINHFGCFEMRAMEGAITRLLVIRGVTIPAGGEVQVNVPIKLKKLGMNLLQFILLNRIGRIVFKEERNISGY